MGEFIRAGDVELWAERAGAGPDVLLIAGLGDPAEAWQAQIDGLAGGHRVIAFDNRGAGRSPLPDEDFSVATLADDAAALLRALDVPTAHIAGFSGGGAIAQELALRHPELVRSLVLMSSYARTDAYFARLFSFWRWMVESAPDARAAFEAFFLWVYTPQAHASGMVDQLVDETLAFPHQQSTEAFQRQIDAFTKHDTVERLHQIDVPTLVLAGELDIIAPRRFSEQLAERIPGARLVVMPGAAHQPFQEEPHDFNARVNAFWREVEQREVDAVAL